MIARYDRFSFSFNESNYKYLKEVNKEGKELNFMSKKQSEFVFYFDSGYLVVVTGNFKKEELINLASSLIPANSALFPQSD